jgi:xanthine dehydrogenase accessory factor
MGFHGKVEELTITGETVAIVTVTNVEGSTPQDPGSEMLVRTDGETIGTVGGGTVEELSRQAAVEAIEERESDTKTWELDPNGNTGMVCGGEMTVFINVVEGKRRLLIAGGGHIGKPLARMAGEMDYEVCVVDDREEYTDPERFPNAEVFYGNYKEGIAHFGVTDNTAVTIATRSGTTDRSAAYEALSQGAYYVGLVASENKANHVQEGLRDDGLDEELIDQLHSPVGLDLGGSDPEDVALSILSELNRVRHGHAPGQIVADELAMNDIG